MKNSVLWVNAVALLLSFCIGGCSRSPSRAYVQFLASDLHFMIAGQHIVVPAVAMGSPGHTFDLNRSRHEKTLKEQLQSEASDPYHPMRVDQLDLSIHEYQYFGDYPASQEHCVLLTRKWSQSQCAGARRGVLRRLPQRFQLLDRSKLELLQYHWTVGSEREYDQVKDLKLRPGATEIGCDRESRFCTAVVEVQPGLLAVWTVWSDEHSGVSAQTMADEQGLAIVQFVPRALGPVEDAAVLNEN
jgi:hypothetical protein